MIVRAPVALVTPRLAHLLEAPLHRLAERARREGVRLDPDVAAFLRDVRVLAGEYRRDLTAGLTDATCAGDAASDLSDDVDAGERTLSSMQVAEMAQISAHGVAEAARRGRLTGRRVDGAWRFRTVDVDAWLGEAQK